MDQEVFATTFQEEIFQIRPKPVVVIDVTWEKLGEKERELLTKIISALRISVDSITIVSQTTLTINSFIGKAHKLIYFGDSKTEISRYEVIESDGLSYICSDSLTQLLENEPARKQLWTGLRKLFSV
jgi:DNA polymerase III psi subunit